MRVLALTLKQPWASLIIYGVDIYWKSIENRIWPLPKTFKTPQRVLIHSSKGHHPGEWHAAQQLCERLGLALPPAEHFAPRGVVLGDAVITGCVTHHFSPWFSGPYGFTLEDRRAWKFPVPAKGTLGFWKYEGPLPAGF